MAKLRISCINIKTTFEGLQKQIRVTCQGIKYLFKEPKGSLPHVWPISVLHTVKTKSSLWENTYEIVSQLRYF